MPCSIGREAPHQAHEMLSGQIDSSLEHVIYYVLLGASGLQLPWRAAACVREMSIRVSVEVNRMNKYQRTMFNVHK